MEEAPRLSIPQQDECSRCRAAYLGQDGVERLPDGRYPRRDSEEAWSAYAAAGFSILHHLSEFVLSKDLWPGPTRICGVLWRPRRAVFPCSCPAANNRSFCEMTPGAYLPPCWAERLPSRITPSTTVLLPCSPRP